MDLCANKYFKFHRQADKFDKEAQEREEAKAQGKEEATTAGKKAAQRRLQEQEQAGRRGSAATAFRYPLTPFMARRETTDGQVMNLRPVPKSKR